jgi:hypothetical protein
MGGFQTVHGVKQEPNAVIGSGRKTVDGDHTPTQLTNSDTPCRGLWIAASPGGGLEISVGDSNVDSDTGSWRGVVIYPGHPGIFLLVDNVNKVWFSGADGATACYTYYV